MKRLLIIPLAVAALALFLIAADSSYQTKVYHQQGGDRLVVASSGSLDVESGGEIDVESGGSLKLAGTAITSTAAELNYLDVTAGTGTVSKALVLDSSGNLTWPNNGDLTSATVGGNDLGGTSGEWGVIYVADSKGIYFGAAQDMSLLHDGTTGLDLVVKTNDSGALTIKDDAGSAVSFLTIDSTTGTPVVSILSILSIADTIDILPATASGSDIGSPTAEWGAITMGTSKALSFGDGQTSFIQDDDTNMLIQADLEIQIQFGTTPISALELSDAAVSSFAAAGDTAGSAFYAETQDGGTDLGTSSSGAVGGLYSLKTGDGSAAVTTGQVGGAGGAMSFTTGAGAAGDTGGDGGAGGAYSVTTGAGAADGGSGTDGNGGGYTITCGQAGGNGGTGGTISLVAGAANSGTAGSISIGGTNATAVTIGRTGGITQVDGNTTIIDSTAAMTLQIGATDILSLDDLAISSFAAEDDNPGQPLYVETEDGGTDGGTTSTGMAGGLFNFKTGDGSAAVTTGAVGGAGGAHSTVTGAGAAGDTAGNGGAGGAIFHTTGAGAADGGSGTDGNGGGYTVTCGQAGGTGGTGGSMTFVAGAANGGTGGSITIGGTNAANVALGNDGDNVTVSGNIITTVGNGTVAGTGVSVVENGNGVVHKTVFTFTSVTITTLADGDHGGGLKIYDFPEGRILILGATQNVEVGHDGNFNASDNDHLDVSIGTAVGADDNSLTGTEQDIIPVIDLDTAAGVTDPVTAASALAASAHFDGTSSAKDLYFNSAVEDTQNSDANVITADSGTLTVTWINLGDY